jgi:hypothetical protein
MSQEPDYTKREIDHIILGILEAVSRIEKDHGGKLDKLEKDHGEKLDNLNLKADYTNGKVKRLYLIMSCIGSVVTTLLITNGSELINIIKIII